MPRNREIRKKNSTRRLSFEQLETRCLLSPVISGLGPLVEGNAANAPLVVNGSGFVSGSVVQWNGAALSTSFVSGSELDATVPGGLVAEQGRVPITVVNPGAGGLSRPFTLTIADAPLTLTLAPLHFTAGANNNVVLGTFTDANPNPDVGDYQAVIHWGDGFVSIASAAAGTITQNGSVFTILGSHTFAKPGVSLLFSVQVQDVNANDSPATFTQMANGGSDGGAYQLGTHTLTRGVDVAHLSQLVGTGGVYDPSVSGPLTSLSYAFDFRTFSTAFVGGQVGVGFLVKQGENYYIAGYHGVGINGWNLGTATALTATSFTRVFGSGPAHPDFSAAGAPLQFGYFTANSTHSGVISTLTWGIDNFRVVLNGTSYRDTNFNNGDWAQLVLAGDNLGAASATQSLTISLPGIATVSPVVQRTPTAPSGQVVVNGAAFVKGAVVQVNGAPVTTTYLTSNQLQATVLTPLAPAAQVQVVNPGPGGGVSNTASIVPDPPLTLTLAPLNLAQGPNNNVVLGTFTDADPNPNINAYQAVIHWGDGFVSTASAAAGTITQNGSVFNILGSHTFAKPSAALPFSLQVQDLESTNAPATATQVLVGGSNGGAYQQGTHTLIQGVDVAHLSNLVAAGGVYDPSVSGPLTALTFSFDFRVFSGASPSDAVGVGFLVKQGETYYIAGYKSVGQNGWNIGATQTATSFTRVVGTGPAQPNFSAGGAPLEFGYFTANSSGGMIVKTLVWGIDNFQVSINGTNYSDTTFNNSNWTQLTLLSDDLVGSSTTQSVSLNIPTLNPVAALTEGTTAPLTLNGAGFLSGAVVEWNGTPLATTFISSTKLQVALPSGSVAEEGSAQIVVANPGSAGGISNSQTLTIADAPLTLTLAPLNFVAGPNNNRVLATFTDADPNANVNDYQAVIHWGDGLVSIASASAGTITQNGNVFSILGSHDFSTKTVGVPSLTFSVQVQDLGANDTPATAVQVLSGGSNGGAYQQGTHTVINGIDVAHLSHLVANGGVYDPSVSGPLTSLTFSYDFRVFAGTSVGVGFLVKQGENYYLAGYTGVAVGGWNIGTPLSATSFIHVFGTGPATPNFSSTGAPLQFGYFTANSGSSSLRTIIWGIDNFQVTINGTTYADTTFSNNDWTQLVLAADNLGAATAAQSLAFSLTDPPITLTVTNNLNLVEGPETNLVVATFTDANPDAVPSNFQAVIHWGDGGVSLASAAAGTITQSGNVFSILGSHVYDKGQIAPGSVDNTHRWTITVQVQDLGPNDTPASATQVVSGGSTGGAYQQGTHNYLTAIEVAHLSNLVGNGGVYNPTVQGPISSLTFSYDFRVFSGAVGVGFLVKQGENYYISHYGGVASGGWNIGTTLNANSFVLIYGSGPATPDFSALGAPLQFGYFTANNGSGLLSSVVWGIDNFHVTINGTTYADTTFNNGDWTQLVLLADNLGAATATGSAAAAVADAPIVLTLVAPTPKVGVPLVNQVVATFTDGDPTPNTSEYYAVIHWGDGFVSTASVAGGTIVANGAGYSILGSHTYLSAASNLSFSVEIDDYSSNDSPVSDVQVASGGSTGGAYQLDTLTMMISQTNLAYLSNTVANGGVYNPAVSGAITSLSESFDTMLLPPQSGLGDGLGIGFLIRQGNNYYVANYNIITMGPWIIGTPTPVTSFIPVTANAPPAPDFSANGAPIQFGFFTSHFCHGWQSFVSGIDNFEVTINGTTYSDATCNPQNWTGFVLADDDFGQSTDSKTTSLSVS